MKTNIASLLFLLALFTIAAAADKPDRVPRTEWPDAKIDALARELHARFLTVDTHFDIPIVLKRPGFDIRRKYSWFNNASQIDFPRMKEGGIDGGFFVIYVGQGKLDHPSRKKAIEMGFTISDLIHKTLEENADIAEIALSPDDAERIRKDGKHVVFIGIENGYTIGRDIDLLKVYFDKGVRYFGITHTKNNDLADSSTDPKGNLHMGLSDLGRAAVEECNRLGIMVDISHASDKTTWDILELSKTPVIASHSASYAQHPHPRNLNDPLLKEIAARNGVVQMNMFSAYMMEVPPDEPRSQALKAWSEKYRGSGKTLTDAEQKKSMDEYIAIEQKYPKALSTVKAVVDHIDHMDKLMGMDHIGISGDFDGGGGVEGAMDVAQMIEVTKEMLRRGYSEEDLKKFWGGNVMRVLQACQDYAASVLPEDDAKKD